MAIRIIPAKYIKYFCKHKCMNFEAIYILISELSMFTDYCPL